MFHYRSEAESTAPAAAVRGFGLCAFRDAAPVAGGDLVALEHRCYASELVDDYILQLTKTNIEQAKNRAFVENHPVSGDPKAVLMVEFFADTEQGVVDQTALFVQTLRAKGLGYAYPVLFGDDTKKPWALRKAGLSIMYNVPGDEKPANVIEDCAVAPADLPDYIDELTAMAKTNHGLDLEYSAHAGAANYTYCR